MGDFYVFKILGFVNIVNIEILTILTALSLFIYFLLFCSFVELYKTFIRKKTSIVFIILAALMPTISIFLLCASMYINVDVQTIEKLYENKLIDEKVVIRIIEDERKRQASDPNTNRKINVSYIYIYKIINETKEEIDSKPVVSDLEKLVVSDLEKLESIIKW